MYSLKAILTKQPIILAGAVIAVVNLAIVEEWITMSAKGVASLNSALILVLGLFVNTVTSNNAVLDEMKEFTTDTAVEAAVTAAKAVKATKPARSR